MTSPRPLPRPRSEASPLRVTTQSAPLGAVGSASATCSCHHHHHHHHHHYHYPAWPRAWPHRYPQQQRHHYDLPPYGWARSSLQIEQLLLFLAARRPRLHSLAPSPKNATATITKTNSGDPRTIMMMMVMRGPPAQRGEKARNHEWSRGKGRSMDERAASYVSKQASKQASRDLSQ